MELEKRLISCKKCKKRRYDVALGTICSLTNELPTFKKKCSQFDIDKFEAKIIYNTKHNCIAVEDNELEMDSVQQMSFFNSTTPILLKGILKLARIPISMLMKFTNKHKGQQEIQSN